MFNIIKYDFYLIINYIHDIYNFIKLSTCFNEKYLILKNKYIITLKDLIFNHFKKK